MAIRAAELAELDLGLAAREAGLTPAVLLAVLDPLRRQHQELPPQFRKRVTRLGDSI
jgi:hypothetical protein